MIKYLFFLSFFLYSSPLFAQPAERLFYSSMHPEGWDIYLSRDAGGTFEKFSSSESLEYNAAFSPDGQWLVYTSEKDGTPRLYARQVDGSGQERPLIQGREMSDQASFSPDGEWLVFASSFGGDTDIFRIPFRPDSLQHISSAINVSNHPGGDFRPAVSPDGQTIAFSSDRDHPIKSHPRFPFAMQRTGDIYLMDWDGSNVRRLISSHAWDGSPAWSADGETIYFYSERTGSSAIYRTDLTGSDVIRVGSEDLKAISPALSGKDQLLVTSWTKDEGDFRLLRLNTTTGEVDSIFHDIIDMHSPVTHPSGLIAFHGGSKPQPNDMNKGGFSGELLVRNHPYTDTLESTPITLYGVRRAFAAPASPSSPVLVVDSTEMESPLDDINAVAFVFVGMILIVLLLGLSGIVLAILRRKKIAFWRYLLYLGGALLLFFLSSAVFGFMAFVDGTPMAAMRLVLGAVAVLLLVLAILAYRTWQKRQSQDKPHYRVSRLMTFTIGLTCLACLYAALLLPRFFDVGSYFFQVNYVTGEVVPLFRVEPEEWLSPANSQIIDMKYLPDDSGFIFTMGSFRSDPARQGDIYRYNFERGTAERLTEEKFNDGFGSYSADIKSFVYRSGKNGNMDLYLLENGQEVQLTNNPSRKNFPAISPDGSAIVFCSDERGHEIEGGVKTMDIYMIRRLENGAWGEPVAVTDSPTQEAHPHFSPDGQWITYTTEEFGIQDEQPLVQHLIFAPQMYGEIVAHRLADGKKIRLTHTKWEDGAPLWERGVEENE